MIPRFRSATEVKYTQTLEHDISDYYQVCDPIAYEALLTKALKRETPVTPEELIALVGTEAYKVHTAYLIEEGYL